VIKVKLKLQKLLSVAIVVFGGLGFLVNPAFGQNEIPAAAAAVCSANDINAQDCLDHVRICHCEGITGEDAGELES